MTSQHDQEKIAQLERALANRRGLVVMAGICDRTTPPTIILQLYRKEPDGSVSVLAMLGQAPEPVLRLDEVVDSLTYVQTPKKENHDSQPVPTIPIQPGAPGTPRADGAGAQGTASDGKRTHCRICGFAVDTSIPPIKPEIPWGGRIPKRNPDA